MKLNSTTSSATKKYLILSSLFYSTLTNSPRSRRIAKSSISDNDKVEKKKLSRKVSRRERKSRMRGSDRATVKFNGAPLMHRIINHVCTVRHAKPGKWMDSEATWVYTLLPHTPDRTCSILYSLPCARSATKKSRLAVQSARKFFFFIFVFC